MEEHADQLGRNYFESGAYIEVFFPQHHIYYIAVNDSVDATMAMESMPLTDKNKQRIHDILDGKITAEEAIQNIIAEYKE